MKSVFGVLNAYNYWLEVIQPNWASYSSASSARHAFNLATSMWHVLEWIEQDEAHPWNTKAAVRAHFENLCSDLGVMHDIATLGKHVSIDPTRDRGGVRDGEGETNAVVLHFGAGVPIMERPIDFVVTFKDGRQRPLREVFNAVYRFWFMFFEGR